MERRFSYEIPVTLFGSNLHLVIAGINAPDLFKVIPEGLRQLEAGLISLQ
jgi:hypothetical protein